MLSRRQRAQQVLLCGVALFSGLSTAGASRPDAVGGGFVDAGIEGAYFANPSFDGDPAFTRRDVRIDFDWSNGRPVGGSSATGYRTFPLDGFSVRWKGQFIPRFSEAYTFSGEAVGEIEIKLRKRGDPTWVTLVDQGADATEYASRPHAMVSGEWYEIEVAYRASRKGARCSLHWNSESVPREVVDPVAQQGLGIGTWERYLWADLVRSARYGKGAPENGQGWPTGSGTELVAAEMKVYDTELSGTYLLIFKGQAAVEKACCSPAVFQAAGKKFTPTLPKAIGWDASSNTTSALFSVEGSRFMLYFHEASRAPGEENTGITNIRMMRPVDQGSQKHHRIDEVVYRPFNQVVAPHFTAFRWGHGGSSDISGRWDDRELPSDPFHARRGGGQGSLEHLVMLANETGKDLYLSTPIAADDEYFRKLALLLRNGSDGREPYSEATSSPTYPPLNTNLRAYVEVGNEIWNWAFPSTVLAQRLVKAEREADSETWAAIDFDGKAGNPEHIGAVRRWHAIRTVACSNEFREVFGDAQMGSRVRMLLEYQYNNAQDSAILSLDFIDTYFGDRSGRYVEQPYPVSHYLWGAGGASYYGLANKKGTQSEIALKDASFEKTEVPARQLEAGPSSSAWTFAGRAGVVRPEGAERVGNMSSIPQPESGHQAAFMVGTAAIEQPVLFTRAGVFALTFQAGGGGPRWPGYAPFDIYVDDQKVSPRSQSDFRVAPGHTKLVGWGRSTTALGEEWGSAPFRIDAPGRHTIRFETHGKPDEYLLVDDIEITSLDAMMESGFGTGQAKGQVSEANFARQLRGQASYARAFGLQVIAYEAGWSAGGDFLQTPLQTWAKLNDPRAREINNRAIEHWAQSGSFMNFWGVFTYWPSWDFARAQDYPIMRSFRDSARSLPSDATYGATLPVPLRPASADVSRATTTGGRSWWKRLAACLVPDEVVWYAWMVIAPDTASYRLRVESSGSGSIIVELDGDPVFEVSSESSSDSVLVRMTKGPHAFRVVVVGDAKLTELDVQPATD